MYLFNKLHIFVIICLLWNSKLLTKRSSIATCELIQRWKYYIEENFNGEASSRLMQSWSSLINWKSSITKFYRMKSNAQSQPVVDVNPTCDIGKVSYMYSRGQLQLSFWRDSPYQICLVELKRFEVLRSTDSNDRRLERKLQTCHIILVSTTRNYEHLSIFHNLEFFFLYFLLQILYSAYTELTTISLLYWWYNGYDFAYFAV